ncbi:MAG TPA: hypothetical protein VF516_17930 [Kofleriaceae bacterium]
MQPFAVEVQTSGGMVLMQPCLQVTIAPRHATPTLQVTSHAHADPQLTAPPHDPVPLQLRLQAPVPQVSELPHDPLPVQATAQVPAPQVTAPPHELGPPQVTLQVPRPHMRFLQVWRALHTIVHDVALSQLTPALHWLGTEHATLQAHPVGHVIAWLQAPLLAEQSIVQVFWAALHEVHGDGHTAASPSGGVSTTPESAAITQNPSTQVRPPAQRCWASQAKSVLRWLIEQPAASATARAVVQSASFTASLRA